MRPLERRLFLQGLLAAATPSDRAGASTERPFDDTFSAPQASPSGIPNAFLLTDERGISFERRTFDEVRNLIDLGGHYRPSAPYISQMARFRQIGITPEDVDFGREIANGADAAIPLREMFGQGHADGVNVFNLAAGQEYRLDSPDPADEDQATAVRLKNVNQDITLNARGATILALSGIHRDQTKPGAILRVEADRIDPAVAASVRFFMNGGKIDTSSLPSASAGLTTVGGLALIGRMHVELASIFFDAGDRRPLGPLVGRGGGDQAVFASGFESYLSKGCIFRGWPDLAEYMSNSHGRGSRHISNYYQWCQRGIALKRFSSDAVIALSRWFENDVCIYNPVSDGRTSNHGGAIQILGNLFERTQSRPVDIGGATAIGSVISSNRSLGHGRQISDGAENPINERLPWLRSRTPGTIISSNYVGLGNMALTRTAGKEQVGIILGYQGGTVDTGATDCICSDNIFNGVYQAYRLEANTFRNKIKNTVRINVIAPDVDAGDNAYSVRLHNNDMVVLRAPASRAVLQLDCHSTSRLSPNGAFHCTMTEDPRTSVWPTWTRKPTGINLTSRTASVGASPTGRFTISSLDDGTVALINRTGEALLINPVWLGHE
jgi:hypothetical protein